MQELAEKSKVRPGALRIEVPNADICFNDKIQGEICRNLAKTAGDFILQRFDGVYAYMLCAPADDGEMGVTQVVRGRDLLDATPSQIWLMQTLGYAVPQYGHIPMLLNPQGRRLAKRDRDLDLGVIRQNTKDPRYLISSLAHIAGLLEKPEPLWPRELLTAFSWHKIPKHDIRIEPQAPEHGEIKVVVSD